MPMGNRGMADMGEMEMPLPDNTIPMMTGWGQFGAIEMGGMFSVVKVREGLAADDYSDPGWYEHPGNGRLRMDRRTPDRRPNQATQETHDPGETARRSHKGPVPQPEEGNVSNDND